MAFVAAAAGGVLVWRASHGNHSDYSCHSQHSKYGDSALRNQISNKESEIRRKESDVESLRQRMNENFDSRINELKREKNYSGLSCVPNIMLSEVKDDMRRELDAEIARDKQELEAIDKMIARINELELQAKRE